MPPSRRQKRWSGRLRTAGALLLLGGTVGVVDRLLPRAADPLGGPSVTVQFGAAAALLALGALAYVIGGRWR